MSLRSSFTYFFGFAGEQSSPSAGTGSARARARTRARTYQVLHRGAALSFCRRGAGIGRGATLEDLAPVSVVATGTVKFV